MSEKSVAAIRQESRRLSAADHAGTIRSFYPFWDVQYRPHLILAVRALPLEAFDFKPRPEMLTARQLVVHIAEGERGWMDHIVDGGPYVEWVTEHEDPARGWELLCDAPDHAALLTMLEEWHRPTQRWLAKPASELSRVITSRGPDGAPRSHTLHWVLDHVQEHEIHHRTQLGLYLRLMGIAPPSL